MAGLGFRDLARDHDGQSQNSVVGDLFSEIHITEIRKLELALEAADAEKNDLMKSLSEAQANLEAARTEMTEHAEKMAAIKAQLSTIDGGEEEGEDDTDAGASEEILAMRKQRRQQELRYEAALEQVCL